MILVTVADDRSGRKGGRYGVTQNFIIDFFTRNKKLGIDRLLMWKWDDIKKSEFYSEYKHRLDITNPQINGRIYKPLAIKAALNKIEDGEFLVYNDTSPELWAGIDSIDTNRYDLDILKKLCLKNGGILTAHVGFDHDGTKHLYVQYPDPGYHIHETFTKSKCLEIMDPDGKFTYCLQHASGFMVLRKDEKSKKFIDEWIYYSSIPDCIEATKDDVQHRTDQSVSGILINKMGNRLVRCLPGHLQHTVINPYNLFSFCQIETEYNFTDSIQPMRNKKIYLDENKINNPKYANIQFSDNWCTKNRDE